MKITIERDGKLYSVPKFSVDIGFNYINIETKHMELIETKPCEHNNCDVTHSDKGFFCSKCGPHNREETKPEEKPQFDDSQLLIGRNTYNPFTNECKEIPEIKRENYNLDGWEKEITNSLNAVIKKINNL